MLVLLFMFWVVLWDAPYRIFYYKKLDFTESLVNQNNKKLYRDDSLVYMNKCISLSGIGMFAFENA